MKKSGIQEILGLHPFSRLYRFPRFLHLARMSSGISFFGKVRAIWRMVVLMLVLAWYLGRLMLVSWISGEEESRGFRYRRKFTQVAMRILGVKLTVQGQAHPSPALYASNHRSLLDPIIELHFIDAYIVSKSEVEKYPLVGRGAKETGVVFLKRESRQSRAATRMAIKELLESHKSVLLYPEGTTSNAHTTREFKPGAFEIAAEVGVPVVPVSIQYSDPSHHWEDGPMLKFFIRKFGQKRIEVRLSIGEPMVDQDPRALMQKVRGWIGKEIQAKAEAKAEEGKA